MGASVKWFVGMLVLLTFSNIGCGGGNGTVATPSSPPPAVPSASITVAPSMVVEGQAVVVAWQTANATDVNISGIGDVALSGSESVTPADTTTYTLTATGPGGAQHATAQVAVTRPPPPSGISAHYKLTILPPVAGGSASEAEAVNDLGEVAGYSVVSGQGEATTWDSAGNPTDLGPGYALGINDSNLIVGYALDANQHPHAVSWKAVPNQIGLDVESAFSVFGLTYDASEALGVDDDGSIVGFAFSMTDPNAQSIGWKLVPNSSPQQVFSMAEVLAIRQGLVGGYDSTFNAVLADATYENILGTFTGVSKDARACGSDFNGGGFVVQNAALKTTGANLYGINSQGVAVGSDLEGAPVGSLRLATRANRKKLQRLDPHDLPLTNKAIAWTEDLGEIGLTNRIDSVGWRLVWATGINESGDIVGVGVNDQDPLTQGFLLTPD